MRKWALLAALLLLAGCLAARNNPQTVVFMVQSSPANLDPRIGTDEVSEHIDELLFDGLVDRDAHFQFKPALATSWEQPNPLTIVFHLRAGVRFSDGRPMTARDVIWSIDSIRNGTVISPKATPYKSIAGVEAVGPLTVIFHLKHPDNFLLTNLSTAAFGVIPDGSGKDFWRHPIGTGPFRFVSQRIDQDVVIAANPDSWAPEPQIRQVRFAVVPDAITMALELEKGSADVEVNSLPMDVLPVLARRANLEVADTPGTDVQYIAFNTRDPSSSTRASARRSPAPLTAPCSSALCSVAAPNLRSAFCPPVIGRGPGMLPVTYTTPPEPTASSTKPGTSAARMASAFTSR